MSKEREQQLRDSRRLARQALGAVALLLAVIGLFTVIGWIFSALRAALDDTDKRRDYEERLYGLVMFDALPFDDAKAVDPSVFRQAAIWGTLYQIQNRDGGFDAYERDAETGSLILPRLEVDTYLTSLLGPDYELQEGSFQTTEFVYEYAEDKQGYLVPITGSVGLYTPKVELIFRRGGRTRVTVGYVPTIFNTSDLMLTIPTEPTKYMDYVFERGDNGQNYLVALESSATQPQATAAPTATPDVITQNPLPEDAGMIIGDVPAVADQDTDAEDGGEPADQDADAEDGGEPVDQDADAE